MHPDIEKLINIAKESGELTERQKEIILRKAEKLGEDVDEVEMMLETFYQAQPNHAKKADEKKMRCPNCGAIVSGISLQCPECGYIFHRESEASLKARDYIKELATELKTIEKRLDLDPTEKESMKATAINAFSVPNTQIALIQLFSLSYSNYIAEKQIFNSSLAPVWLGKAKSSYLLLKSQSNIDAETSRFLKDYSFIEDIVYSDRIQRREKENVDIVRIKENTRKEVSQQESTAKAEIGLYVMCAVMMIAIALIMIFSD